MDISRLQAGEHEFHCRLHTKGGRTSDTYSYTFSLEESQGIDVTFDGLVLSVNSDVNMKDALEYVGGRDSVASTTAAVMWNSRIPLTEADLQGITNPNLLVYVSRRELAPQSVQNVVVDGTAQRIVLTDDGQGNCDFYAPQAFTARRIKYSRTFSQYLEGSVFERDYREVRPFEAYVVHRQTGSSSGNPSPKVAPVSGLMGLEATGIEDVMRQTVDDGADDWWTLDGRRLQGRPAAKGVYIRNGRKRAVR